MYTAYGRPVVSCHSAGVVGEAAPFAAARNEASRFVYVLNPRIGSAIYTA